MSSEISRAAPLAQTKDEGSSPSATRSLVSFGWAVAVSAGIVRLNGGRAGETRSRKALRRPARPRPRLRRSRWLDIHWELNGKVFTGRLGRKPANVLFDRICLNNGIRHLLTAPYSPTTTGKVERFHRTLRKDFFAENSFDTIEDMQSALDVWVIDYNNEREHQSLGD